MILTMTSRSKFFLILSAFVFVLAIHGAVMAASATTAATAPEAYSAEKLELAKKYVATVPVENDIKRAVEELALKIKPEQRVLYRSLAEKSIDYNRLRAAAELATAELFTEKEIEAMTAFFSSPEGQSVRAKLPKFEERMQPIMIEVMQSFAMKLQENNITPMPEP